MKKYMMTLTLHWWHISADNHFTSWLALGPMCGHCNNLSTKSISSARQLFPADFGSSCVVTWSIELPIHGQTLARLTGNMICGALHSLA